MPQRSPLAVTSVIVLLLLSTNVARAENTRVLLYTQARGLKNSIQIVTDLQASLTTQFRTLAGLKITAYTPTAAPIKEALAAKRLAREDLREVGSPSGFRKILSALGFAGGILVSVDRVQAIDGVDLALDASVSLYSGDDSASFSVAARASKYEAKYATGYERRTVYDVAAQQLLNELKSRSTFFRIKEKPVAPSPTPEGKGTATTGSKTVELAQSSDTEVALRALAEASAASPRDPSLYIEAGDIYLKKGQIGYAILEYRRAVYVDPKNRSGLQKLGQAYLQRGQVSRTLETAQIMIGLGYDDGPLRYLMAQARLALRAFHESNGRVREAQAEYDKALEEFKKAASLDRNNLEICLDYGKQLLSSERFREAVMIYQHASELAPKNAEVWQSLALSLLGTGDYHGGVESLAQSLAFRETAAVAFEPGVYTKVLRLTDGYARDLYLQERSDLSDFADRKLAAEIMLSRAQKLCETVGKLTAVMNSIDPPIGKQRMHLQRILSYQLLAQAASTVVTYVETNDASYQERAALLLTEFADQYEAAHTSAATRNGNSSPPS